MNSQSETFGRAPAFEAVTLIKPPALPGVSDLRAELANHYLANTSYSSAEISFLLGYSEPSSFFRAFHIWTGKTPEVVRKMSQLQ